MAELLPCPFCGGEAQLYTWHKSWVSHGCNVIGGYIYVREFDTEAEAIAAWNTRANDTLTGEKVTTQDSETVTTRTCRMEQIQPPKILEGWYRCSTCGEVYPPCNPEIAKWALQYCPRCGAKVVD